MKKPFSNPVRIAVVLLTGVLLFNLFAYYIVRLRARENEQLVSIVTLASRQGTLSEVVCKDISMLTNANLHDSARTLVLNELDNAIDSFSKQEILLDEKVNSLNTTSDTNALTILHLLSETKTHSKAIFLIASEMTGTDGSGLTFYGRSSNTDLLNHEQKLVSLLDTIVVRYTGVVNDKMDEASALNTRKLASLILMLVALTVLVLE